MKYLMLIKHAETTPTPAPPDALMSAMGEFVQKGLSSGILKETAGLKPTSAGYRIRSAGGTLQTFDGPFTETKEVIGGFAIIETTSEAEAQENARQFMELHRLHWPEFECECEVRPLEDM
ncbi:MAG: YciI family protein [Vicinamibacterales bacterium]